MKKPIYKKWWFWVIAVFLVYCVWLGSEPDAADADSTEPSEHTQMTTQATEPTDVSLPGSAKSNPIVITVDELVAEVEADIDAAKAKYNDKWVQITGEVKNHYSVSGMTGYYLYGDRGDPGLRIICWCDGGPHSGSMVGNTYTFIGIVREVTIMNATEIGECEIIVEK